MKFIVIAGLLLLTVRPAAAETAEEMLAGCRAVANAEISNGSVAVPSTPSAQQCWGALGIIRNAIYYLQDDGKTPAFHVCAPTDVTRPQLAAIFVDYLSRNPVDRNKEFLLVVLNSLLKVYVCNGKR